jgi:hypothetical protein
MTTKETELRSGRDNVYLWIVETDYWEAGGDGSSAHGRKSEKMVP